MTTHKHRKLTNVGFLAAYGAASENNLKTG